jgi:hypothetical protein
MATPRRMQFVHGVVAWQLATVVALALLGAMELELLFVVSLIGFLVVTELTAPFNVTPRWRSRLKWLIALGLAVFGYVVLRRILEILPAPVVDLLVPFVARAAAKGGSP